MKRAIETMNKKGNDMNIIYDILFSGNFFMELLRTTVRKGLYVLGGYFLSRGDITQPDLDTVVAGGLILVTALWSYIERILKNKVEK